MHEKLEAIRNAWDKEVGDGRDEELARRLADEFVAENPDLYTDYKGRVLEDVEGVTGLVSAVDVLRQAGMLEEQWRVEAWLLHRFNPQDIGGSVSATVRIPTMGG